jgi:hypothetical protein
MGYVRLQTWLLSVAVLQVSCFGDDLIAPNQAAPAKRRG